MPATTPLTRRVTPRLARTELTANSAIGHTSSSGTGTRDALASNLLIITNTFLRACSNLLIMPLMVSMLGQERYGLWITISMVTMYLSLSDSGLGQTIVNKIGKAYTRGRLDQISEIMATAHVLYWLIVLPVGVISVALIMTLPLADIFLSASDAHFEPLLRVCLVLSTVLALARIPMLVFPGLLIGVRRLPLRVGWEIGGTLFTLATTAIALVSGVSLVGLTIVVNTSLLLSTAAISLSSSHCGIWACLRISNFRAKFLRPLAMNSGFFFLISAAGVLDRSIAALLVPRFTALAFAPPFFLLTSIFRVAAYSFVVSLPRAVQPYVVMWEANRDAVLLTKIAKLLTKGTMIVSALIVALFVPFAKVFVETWLQSDCYPGNAVFVLVVGAFLVDTLSSTSIHFLLAMNRQRGLSLLMATKAVLTVVLAIGFAMGFADPLVGIAAGGFVASVLAGLGVPFLILPALAIDWKSYGEHFVVRPVVFAVLIPAIVAVATSQLTLAVRPMVTFLLLAIGGWFGWRSVFDAADREVVRQSLVRLRLISR